MTVWIKFVFKSTLVVGSNSATTLFEDFVLSFKLMWIVLIEILEEILKPYEVGKIVSIETNSLPESSKSILSKPTIASSEIKQMLWSGNWFMNSSKKLFSQEI